MARAPRGPHPSGCGATRGTPATSTPTTSPPRPRRSSRRRGGWSTRGSRRGSRRSGSGVGIWTSRSSCPPEGDDSSRKASVRRHAYPKSRSGPVTEVPEPLLARRSCRPLHAAPASSLLRWQDHGPCLGPSTCGRLDLHLSSPLRATRSVARGAPRIRLGACPTGPATSLPCSPGFPNPGSLAAVTPSRQATAFRIRRRDDHRHRLSTSRIRNASVYLRGHPPGCKGFGPRSVHRSIAYTATVFVPIVLRGSSELLSMSLRGSR